MKQAKYRIFVCNSFRLTGEPQGVCNKRGAPNLLQVLQDEIVDRGIDAMVVSTGCLKMCDKGPVMTIEPQGWCYGEVDEDKLDTILDAMEEDEPVEELLL